MRCPCGRDLLDQLVFWYTINGWEVTMTTGDIEAVPVDEVLVDSLIPRVVAAFNAHDADAFVAVMTEDVVFTMPHLHPCMDAPR